MAGREPLQRSSKQVTLLGKQYKTTLDSVTFGLILDLWGVEDKPFDSFRTKYKKYAERKRRNREEPVAFANWREVASRDNTPEEQQWQSIPTTAYTVERFLLDGVLFRSDILQKRKGLKTDNSCIISHANISYATEKQRTAPQRIEKCYGRLQGVYVHFKYPPSKQQLKNATTKRKMDPCKVGVPFLILGKCSWYMQKAVPHINTGLTQIKPHPAWDRDCPFVKLSDCLSMNVAYWPADPFSQVTEESEMVVITHHEEVPVVYNVI